MNKNVTKAYFLFIFYFLTFIIMFRNFQAVIHDFLFHWVINMRSYSLIHTVRSRIIGTLHENDILQFSNIWKLYYFINDSGESTKITNFSSYTFM